MPATTPLTDGVSGQPDQTLTLHAEDLEVTKRQTVRTVQVRRATRTHDTLVEEALQSSGVVIEHVPVGAFVAGRGVVFVDFGAAHRATPMR